MAPSTFPEAFGMVAAEGAATGALPVVARHSGLAEVSSALAERVSATVRIAGDTARLKAFAERNACGYQEGVDPGAELKRFGVANDLPKGRYASLSCRERDSQR